MNARMPMRALLKGASVLLAAGLFAIGVGPAQAGFISSILSPGADNTFEDVSREGYYNANGAGTFGVGDVLTGFVEIDRKTAPTSKLTLNQIYAIFSVQVVQIIPASPTQNFVLFGPATVPGLQLSTLVPGAGATDMVAVFDRTTPFPFDLVLSSPGDPTDGDAVTLADYFNSIETNGTLEMTAGPTHVQDFFISTVGPLAGFTTTLIPTYSPTDTLGVTGAALAANVNNLGVGLGPDTGSAINPLTGFPAHDQLQIARGGISGTTGLVNASEWTNLQDFVSGHQCGTVTTNGGCGFSDNALFTIHPLQAVPEPGSLALLGVALMGMAGVRRRRRNTR